MREGVTAANRQTDARRHLARRAALQPGRCRNSNDRRQDRSSYPPGDLAATVHAVRSVSQRDEGRASKPPMASPAEAGDGESARPTTWPRIRAGRIRRGAESGFRRRRPVRWSSRSLSPSSTFPKSPKAAMRSVTAQFAGPRPACRGARVPTLLDGLKESANIHTRDLITTCELEAVGPRWRSPMSRAWYEPVSATSAPAASCCRTPRSPA